MGGGGRQVHGRPLTLSISPTSLQPWQEAGSTFVFSVSLRSLSAVAGRGLWQWEVRAVVCKKTQRLVRDVDGRQKDQRES